MTDWRQWLIVIGADLVGVAEEQSLISEWLQWLITASAGLAGVALGAWLTTGRERAARRHRFVQRQLEDFCAPLVGLHQEIRAKSELRETIRAAAGVSWAELCQEAREADRASGGVAHTSHFQETKSPEFQRIIEHDNSQLRDHLLPAYQEMLDLFRDNMWLADASTRAHYPQLLRFVEIWNRWLNESLPPEVVEKVEQREETLKPFYENIEEQMERLRSKLESGSA